MSEVQHSEIFWMSNLRVSGCGIVSRGTGLWELLSFTVLLLIPHGNCIDSNALGRRKIDYTDTEEEWNSREFLFPFHHILYE